MLASGVTLPVTVVPIYRQRWQTGRGGGGKGGCQVTSTADQLIAAQVLRNQPRGQHRQQQQQHRQQQKFKKTGPTPTAASAIKAAAEGS